MSDLVKRWFRTVELSDHRVRIRVNYKNLGASLSRTRGWSECHSSWVLFLDDDVDIQKDLVLQYSKYVSQDSNVSGYVGKTNLTHNHSLVTNGVHWAQTSFFWHISDYCDVYELDVPWGVTANILFKWIPGMEFHTDFPKTGGGEDIQFCIELRHRLKQPLKPAKSAECTHPWWDNGHLWPIMKRHRNWALGDGLLLLKNPHLTYRAPPNFLELMLFIFIILIAASIGTGNYDQVILGFVILPILLALGETIGSIVFILWKRDTVYSDQFAKMRTGKWMSIVISVLIRGSSKLGQLQTILMNGRLDLLCCRFDWFTGILDHQPWENMIRELVTIVCHCTIIGIYLMLRIF